MAVTPPLAARLDRARAVARMVLWCEQLLIVLWPAVCVVALFVALAWLGLFALLPPWPHAVVLGGFALALLGVLGVAARRLRRPAVGAADRWLEENAGLTHRPLAALSDRPASSDPLALALWQAHAARAAGALGRLRLRGPRPALAVHDRRALRAGAALLLLTGLVVAGEDASARLGAAFDPGFAPEVAAAAPQLVVWVTPPAYTGQAPLLLRAAATSTAAVSVPAGSRLVVDLTGSGAEPTISYGGQALAATRIGPQSWQAAQELTGGGQLLVRRRGGVLGSWSITTLADQPPLVAFAGPPVALARSREIRVPWQASDDYGVTGLRLLLRLPSRPNTASSALEIPLSGAPKEAHGVWQHDLTAHPWAGLDVTLQLLARDGAAQEGLSRVAQMKLPERVFTNPLARALIGLRRQLSLVPQLRVQAAQTVRMLGEQTGGEQTAAPPDASVAVNLGAISGILRHDRHGDAVAAAQERMWVLALALEEGGLNRATRALEAARQAVRDALAQTGGQPQDSAHPDAAAPGKPADPALARRLEELRAAIQRQLQALIEQAKRDRSLVPFDPSAHHLSGADVDRMLRRIEQAARDGRQAEAQQQMAELDRLLEQMRNAEAAGPAERRQARQAQRQSGRQQMSAAQDMAGREDALARHAGQHAIDQKPAGQRATDAQVQQALRRALGELAQRFGDLTGSVPLALAEADQAMRTAQAALAARDAAGAGAAEAQAAEALRRGNRQMGQQMGQQLGLSVQPGAGGQGQDGEDSAMAGQDGGDGSAMGEADADGDDEDGGAAGRAAGQGPRQGGSRDPLGRLTDDGAGGGDEGSDLLLPEQRGAASTRAIQQELRRRGGQKDRPADELRYIDRLLQAP